MPTPALTAKRLPRSSPPRKVNIRPRRIFATVELDIPRRSERLTTAGVQAVHALIDRSRAIIKPGSAYAASDEYIFITIQKTAATAFTSALTGIVKAHARGDNSEDGSNVGAGHLYRQPGGRR